MSSSPPPPTTSIATHTAEDVFVRGRSLCRELIGKVTFTEMTYPTSRVAPRRRPRPRWWTRASSR
jgi:hypothetical protein